MYYTKCLYSTYHGNYKLNKEYTNISEWEVIKETNKAICFLNKFGFIWIPKKVLKFLEIDLPYYNLKVKYIQTWFFAKKYKQY